MSASTNVDASEHPPPSNGWTRLAAIAEVLGAFALVHVGFRAVKHFTAVGRWESAAGTNFTPGFVMILFTVCVLLLCRRSFTAYGLSLARWTHRASAGLFWGLVLVAGVGLLALCGVHYQPGHGPPGLNQGVIYGLASLAAVVLFGWLFRRQGAVLNRLPPGLCAPLLVGFLGAPLVVALVCERPLARTLLTVLWLVFGAACGEEVFYRGYIQSRVNEAFGRPLRLLGIPFGAGLLVSSVLFGFLHTLNTVDYFQGRFTFAWGFGVANVGTGLLYGWLREGTGSIVAGVVTHAILDVLVIVPGLIAGP